jgi:hypothetical protein
MSTARRWSNSSETKQRSRRSARPTPRRSPPRMIEVAEDLEAQADKIERQANAGRDEQRDQSA